MTLSEPIGSGAPTRRAFADVLARRMTRLTVGLPPSVVEEAAGRVDRLRAGEGDAELHEVYERMSAALAFHAASRRGAPPPADPSAEPVP